MPKYKVELRIAYNAPRWTIEHRTVKVEGENIKDAMDTAMEKTVKEESEGADIKFVSIKQLYVR